MYCDLLCGGRSRLSPISFINQTILILYQLHYSVLKSDNANGLFGFDGPCIPTILNPESNEALEYTCSVVRSRGDEGIVTIPWEVRNQATGQVATGDFVNATGEVVFPNGVRTKVR